MPAKPPTVPRYRHHKARNLGVVRIHGQDHYLGPFNSPESVAKYARLIAQHFGESLPASISPTSATSEEPALTINGLMVAFWHRHVTVYYRKHGRATSEQDNFKQALRFLLEPYGNSVAGDFRPTDLKRVRELMIKADRCRNLVNKDINRIRKMFRWGVTEELVPGSVPEALNAVDGLRAGRSEARESEPIRPVPEEHFRATLRFLDAQVAAMAQFQLLTGARPGEATCVRPCDIQRTDENVWHYYPQEHKSEHHGRTRVIVIGPRAREVLAPWLDRKPDGYCFSPAEVVTRRYGRQPRGKPPLAKRTKKAGKSIGRRGPGERYTKDSYRVAIQRAAERAKVPRWTPLQLRHNAATAVRKRFGLDGAQVLLGHAEADTSQIYAEKDLALATQIAMSMG